jgi:hypothetical protein
MPTQYYVDKLKYKPIVNIFKSQEINSYCILRPAEFESTQIVWKTKGLPLTYSRISHIIKQ